MYSALIALVVFPLLAFGQSSSSNTTVAPSGNATAAVSTTVVFTSLSTGISIGPGRVETTVVATQRITSVLPIATTNTTAGNNTTANATTSASTTTTPANLPTAPTNVDGGGQGGAPVPGATGNNGAFGPGDGYIAAASTLAKNALAVSLLGSLIGGALVVF
ncbi:hypothetical protein BDZ97DRAFT_408557 [Flammula alnicola]|nr:hypothetical protein BDZ97DRAFT_408557 [Flammula alnicola]